MKIGFIGLGMMGAGMAGAICRRQGTNLSCTTCARQAASRHLNNGAVWAESPRALAEAVGPGVHLAADAGRRAKRSASARTG